MRRSAPLALSLALAAACAAPAGSVDPNATSDSSLLNGRFTFERPEVGSIRTAGSCTATLFGSARTVITAAHCVSYQSRGPGNHGDFTLEPRPGERYRFPIAQIVVFGASHESSASDVALLQLAEPVPAHVATPAAPALSSPAFGERMTIYGYGCQIRPIGGVSQDRTFAKQAVDHGWGDETRNLCPGDSGGPTLTSDGRVTRVNSAYISGSSNPADIGRDLFGDVTGLAHEILPYVQAWRGGSALVWDGALPPPSDPPPTDPAPSDPPPFDPPADPPSDPGPSDVDLRCGAHLDCGACVADSYCGWCNGGCTGLHIDASGQVAGNGCTEPAALRESSCPADLGPTDPPPPAEPPPTNSQCGDWAGVSEYTCSAGETEFARCGPHGLDIASCPSGSRCQAGSTSFYCAI